MIETTKFDTGRMSGGAVSGHALATEIADYLAKQGVPFAHAHEVSGACVKLADSLNIEVHELSDNQLKSIDSKLPGDIRSVLNGAGATASRTSVNGTSEESVAVQIKGLENSNKAAIEWITNDRNSFSRMMSI